MKVDFTSDVGVPRQRLLPLCSSFVCPCRAADRHSRRAFELAMQDLERSALIRGVPPMWVASSGEKGKQLKGKARHPRSRSERLLLQDLQKSLGEAIEIARQPGSYDALLAEAEARAAARPLAVMADPDRTHLASNGGQAPSLFYEPPPVSGVGLKYRGTPFAGAPRPGLSPDEDAALRHYGVQQLTDYARASLLGEIASYLPPHREEATCRQRFDSLISRVQQHQAARTVHNELRAKEPDSLWNWNENRFHLAPVTGSQRVVPVDSWAEFIRGGGDASKADVALDILGDVRAERHLPTPNMRTSW